MKTIVNSDRIFGRNLFILTTHLEGMRKFVQLAVLYVKLLVIFITILDLIAILETLLNILIRITLVKLLVHLKSSKMGLVSAIFSGIEIFT